MRRWNQGWIFGMMMCLVGGWASACGPHRWIDQPNSENNTAWMGQGAESVSSEGSVGSDAAVQSEQNPWEVTVAETAVDTPESVSTLPLGCTPGETRRCYPGPASTRGQGTCSDGVQSCDGAGTWGSCENARLPQAEKCNGLDDDCNGWIDDVEFCVYTIAGTGIEGFRDGSGKTALFRSPAGIVVTSEGIIYVADTANHRIRKIDRSGQVTTYAGDGIAGDRDGDRTEAQFSHPGALALGAEQSLYVADTVNHRIRRIAPNGQVSTWAGSVLGFRDGSRQTAKFYFPSSLAVDQEGRVFVADTLNHAIRRIDRDGQVTTIAGDGNSGYRDEPGRMAQFHMPLGIAVGLENHLLIADAVNNMIRLLSATGQVSTVAGDGVKGYRDGAARQARFFQPPGVATDHKGNVYVADTANQRIRKITPAGEVSSIAGTGQRGFRDGWGTQEAELFGPTGIVVGPHHRLYFTDFNSHSVRVLQLPRP